MSNFIKSMALSPVLEFRMQPMSVVDRESIDQDCELEEEKRSRLIRRLSQLLRGKAVHLECELGDYSLNDELDFVLVKGSPERILVYCINEGLISLESLENDILLSFVQGMGFRETPMSLADDLLLSGPMTNDDSLNRLNTVLLEVEYMFNRGPAGFYLISPRGEMHFFEKPRKVVSFCLQRRIIDPSMLLVHFKSKN